MIGRRVFQSLHLLVTAEGITQKCHVLMVLDPANKNQTMSNNVRIALLLTNLEVYVGYVWSTVWILNQIKNSIPNQEASHSRVGHSKSANLVCNKRKQWDLRQDKKDKWASWPGLASGSPKSWCCLKEEGEIMAEPWVAVNTRLGARSEGSHRPPAPGWPSKALAFCCWAHRSTKHKIRTQDSLLSRMGMPAGSLLRSFEFPQSQYLR